MVNIELSSIPEEGLENYIEDLAMKHQISLVMTGHDALARVVTRLSGDDVVPDKTENLVVALRRANVIDGSTMVKILGRYLNAKYNI